MRKAHVLVSTLCRLLITGIRSLTWRKVSILATFTILAFIAVTLMQRYFAATKLSNLLERGFIERPTRSGVSLVDNQRITNGIDSTNFQQSVPGRIDYFEPSVSKVFESNTTFLFICFITEHIDHFHLHDVFRDRKSTV